VETVIGIAEYPLPDNFAKMRIVCMAMGAYFVELQPISPGQMAAIRARTPRETPLTGMPMFYAITDRMVIWPAPSEEWEIERCWDAPCRQP
jgi:hypothetical protein